MAESVIGRRVFLGNGPQGAVLGGEIEDTEAAELRKRLLRAGTFTTLMAGEKDDAITLRKFKEITEQEVMQRGKAGDFLCARRVQGEVHVELGTVKVTRIQDVIAPLAERSGSLVECRGVPVGDAPHRTGKIGGSSSHGLCLSAWNSALDRASDSRGVVRV